MNGYAVAHLDEIEELSDGRCPWRPVRHHFGITSFGVNASTGRETGDRIINEHDESDADDNDEELYVVQSGRATFELDGERVDAPAGTFVFARLGVKRTAFAEEPGTTIVALGGTPEGVRADRLGDLGAAQSPLRGRRVRRGRRPRPRAVRSASRVRRSAVQPGMLREPGRAAADAIDHSGSRSTGWSGAVRSPSATPTSTRSATSGHSRSSWASSREERIERTGIEPGPPACKRSGRIAACVPEPYRAARCGPSLLMRRRRVGSIAFQKQGPPVYAPNLN
jgi:hypothetical protein